MPPAWPTSFDVRRALHAPGRNDSSRRLVLRPMLGRRDAAPRSKPPADDEAQQLSRRWRRPATARSISSARWKSISPNIRIPRAANEIERALVKAAIESKDNKRMIEYGERVLAREPSDVQILDKVVRALLVSSAADTSERALKYARHYEELLRQTRSQTPPGHMSVGPVAGRSG